MLFFKANEIERDSKKWAILLSSFVAETYNAVKSLAIPMKPAEKYFKEIVDLLKEHQIPEPNKITERSKCNTRDKKEGNCYQNT